MARPKTKPEEIYFGGVPFITAPRAAELFNTTLPYLRVMVKQRRVQRYRLPGYHMMNFFRETELRDYFEKTGKRLSNGDSDNGGIERPNYAAGI